MIVLGINHSNDSAATLVRDGHVIAASKEERFSRIKHDSAFPHQAIDFCLNKAGITLDDLDSIAFFWNPGIHAATYNRRMSGAWRHHLEFLYNVPNQILSRMPGETVSHIEQIHHLESGKALTVHYVTHHLCHAASVLFCAPFEDCAILTVDGYGERASTHMAMGSGTRIETLHTIEFPHSVGSMYAAFTQYLGFRANNGEGKVMGLASYGRPTLVDTVRQMVELTEDGFRLDLSYFGFYHDQGPRYSDRLVEALGPPRSGDDPIDKRHEDIAFAVQSVTEEILLHLVEVTRKKSGASNLGMAGGVVLNCVANGRIARESGFDSLFFQPAAGDAGTSMGAALWVTHCLKGVPPTGDPANDYLGLSYTNEEIEGALKKAAVSYRPCSDPCQQAATFLAEGKIIGWFQGAAELGPRALGNRSILADPRGDTMKDTLNARVKFREGFRPFAPSCLEERCGELFDCDHPSPFMLRVYSTLEERRQDLAAITHVDGTARVQTVNPTQNQRYYDLISAFDALTGVPCVLNTSFNIRGEPIVNTVEDALKCFFTTDMDALFLGDFLVERQDEKTS